MDGGRCADLIRSHREAWPIWLGATLALAAVAADKGVVVERELHARVSGGERLPCLHHLALARPETAQAIVDNDHLETTAGVNIALTRAAKLSTQN